MFPFCSKSKCCSLQTFLAWDLGLEKWCCWGESCKSLSQPIIWKRLLFVLQHSRSSHHHKFLQDFTPTWDVYLLVTNTSQMFLPWKGVTVQSDAVECCSKAVQGIFQYFYVAWHLWFLLTCTETWAVWPALLLHIWSFVHLPGTADTKQHWLKIAEEIVCLFLVTTWTKYLIQNSCQQNQVVSDGSDYFIIRDLV